MSAPDSNIIINVDSGTVPEGVNQRFFYRVVYDETTLLRDIPETPDRTLIAPVIHCGPENINLLKPVEIIVPHCLYLDEVKKESVSVYRCGNYAVDGNLLFVASTGFFIKLNISMWTSKTTKNIFLKEKTMSSSTEPF